MLPGVFSPRPGDVLRYEFLKTLELGYLRITIWSEDALSAGSSLEPTLPRACPLKYRGSWMGDSCSSSAALSIIWAVSMQQQRSDGGFCWHTPASVALPMCHERWCENSSGAGHTPVPGACAPRGPGLVVADKDHG